MLLYIQVEAGQSLSVLVQVIHPDYISYEASIISCLPGHWISAHLGRLPLFWSVCGTLVKIQIGPDSFGSIFGKETFLFDHVYTANLI